MRQHVTDISKVIRGLSLQIESMQKTIDSQHSTICQINRNSQAQLKENRALKNKLQTLQDENRKLRERLAKYENPAPPKDSDNSSTPAKQRTDEIRGGKTGQILA